MFNEDEKDSIKANADISIKEDGTVTWKDVLNSENDDLIILDQPEEEPTVQRQQPVNPADVLESELEFIKDDDEEDDAGEIDDNELMEILNKDTSSDDVQYQDEPQDYDIDQQLASTIQENHAPEEEITLTPRRNEVKSSSSAAPMLIFLILAGVIAYGAYYFMTQYTANKNLDQEAIAPIQTPQQEMNNITQEQLEQRQAQENIMVVNEDQANEVQPEVKEEEKTKQEEKNEKRKVVNVIPTGRSNPFLPISKYMTTRIPDTNLDYDRVGIPKPPETYGTKDLETTKLMSIAVSGIMYDETKPSAIITYDNNDYFVQKGDRLDDYKVLDIAKTYVTLAYKQNIYKANIGEEFKVSTQFYGSADFIPSNQGGGRQYHSISAQERQAGVQQQLRYVSESDITINAK